MAKTRPDEPAVNPRAWLLTFSDMVTLMLTFFVMLLAMSSLDMGRLKSISSAFNTGSGVLGAPAVSRPIAPEEELEKLSQLKLDQLPREEELLDIFLGQADPQASAAFENLKEDIRLRRTSRGLALIFGSRLFFESGQAAIKAEGLPLLERLAVVLKQLNRPVSLEGHTDSTPLAAGGKYQTNWDLSLARAIAVRDILVRRGVSPSRLRLGALAQARPLVDDATPEGRALNRRIEIVFDWLR